MMNYDMTFDPMRDCTLNEGLHRLYNKYGRGKITIEQFLALYLENKLDDYIEKQRKETE